MQNRTAYLKCSMQCQINAGRVTLHHSSSLPGVLPPLLVELAARPQPTSHLFLEALQGTDSLDESELPDWDKDPPYSQPEPSDTPEENRFTKNLMDVMAGRRMKVTNEAKTHHAQHYQVGEREELIVDVHAMAVSTFRQWVQLKDIIESCRLCRHAKMAKSVLQWRAFLVCSYLNKVHWLEMDKNPYDGLLS